MKPDCDKCTTNKYVNKVAAKGANPPTQLGQSSGYGKTQFEWQCGKCQTRWPFDPKPKAPPAPPIQQADNEEKAEDKDSEDQA
ncbi:MAG: hypothetical protein CME33_19685 [Gimesia sp.]|uniref:hypothetical protein n=1 Tax=Gimesia sp. TaxID=2024833 RepID=UPI000C43DF7E|nr:hypothetical protein [Gimesia sp.]MAX38785.1 hypothetical protein [Gimesia sp.]|tara:strand:- start:1868 stop:2116 length:249 start_codon:yes stop_codon:yes gene_type:complete